MRKSILIENYKNIMTLALFAGIILGMLVANLFFGDYLKQVGMLGSAFLKKYQYTEVEDMELLLYLLRSRLPVIVFLAVAGNTRWGGLCSLVYALWLGFSGGMLFAMATMQKGFSGVLLVLMSLLPQYLAYIPGMLLLFYGIFTRLRGRKEYGRTGGKIRNYLMILTVVLLLFTIGILMETYVNPIFIKKLLKNY